MIGKHDKYALLYSPRTSKAKIVDIEDKLFNDLKVGFDPFSVKIIKKHFKEHLGRLNKITFIAILKRHLLSWHPELKNRELILIKLLSKLFDEIDLNSNGFLEWDEFTNYIIHTSNENSYENSLYNLQQYAICKNLIDNQEKKNNFGLNYLNKVELVTYSFYLKKYKLIGIVHEDKSKILFFDAETHKKVGCEIDILDTQEELDQLEIKELNIKTEISLKKQEEKMMQIKQRGDIIINKKVYQNSGFNLNNNNNISHNNIQNKDLNDTTFSQTAKPPVPTQNRPETPESVKKLISKIYKDNHKKTENQRKKTQKERKLSIICTCFVSELNLLFVSSINNIISSWSFIENYNVFKNANTSNELEFKFEKDHLKIPLFATDMPQYTMCYDKSMRYLYSGQEDGKILKWEMDKFKPVEIFDINTIDIGSYILISKDKSKKEQNKESIKSLSKSVNINNSSINNNSADNEKEKLLLIKEQKNRTNIQKFDQQKSDTVSCLIMLTRLRLLCSSYYNGKIILWDSITKKPKKIFNDQQTGIYQIVYDPYKNYIYTCGFDHDIYIYDPYNDDGCIYKLKGHTSSVKSISINPEEEELISIDIQGNIKIWDVNNFNNFQTINVNDSILYEQNHVKKQQQNNNVNDKSLNKKISANIFVIAIPVLKKIIVYGDKFMMYEKCKSKNPNLCDDNIILGCVYNKLTTDLISFSSKKIKMWNIYTGKIKKIFNNLMDNNEITAFTLDKQMKRLYLGDSVGRIKNFNNSTGNYLKSFVSHKTEIVNILHSFKYEILISCSSDLIVKFQNDKELLESNVIKEISAFPMPVSNINNIDKITLREAILNENNGILILALSNSWISYFDVDHYKLINNLSEAPEFSRKHIGISSIADLGDSEMLFIAYENGDIGLNAKTKHKYYKYLAGEKFGNFGMTEEEIEMQKRKNDKNYGYSEEYKKKNNIVISTVYDEETFKLFTGDHLGYIKCYNLKPLIEFEHNVFDEKSEEYIKNAYKNEIQINLIWFISAHKEAIKFLSIPLELNPKIIISTGNDKAVKLFDFETGKFIDSLKQVSLKYNPIPIAIRYIKDNPFLKQFSEEDTEKGKEKIEEKKEEKKLNFNYQEEGDELVNDNEVETIYRSKLNEFSKPKIDYEKNGKSDIVEYSNQVLQFNAKMKLFMAMKDFKIKPNRSTSWNYEVDIESLDKIKEEKLIKLYFEICKKDDEINKTELAYQTSSIFNNNYKPFFLKNLSEEEKKDLNMIISDKIRNVRLAIAKNKINKHEQKVIESISGKDRKKVFLTPLNVNVSKKQKKKNNKNTEIKDERFEKCRIMFNDNYNELALPFQYLLNQGKRYKILPKLDIKYTNKSSNE